jgi:hypothetical protein
MKNIEKRKSSQRKENNEEDTQPNKKSRLEMENKN